MQIALWYLRPAALPLLVLLLLHVVHLEELDEEVGLLQGDPRGPVAHEGHHLVAPLHKVGADADLLNGQLSRLLWPGLVEDVVAEHWLGHLTWPSLTVVDRC